MQVPLIAEVQKLGLNTIVSDYSSDCVCEVLADKFLQIDIFDIEGHVSALKVLMEEGYQIVGVLAAGIDAPETMTTIAKFLGLPSVETETAHLVHNKHKFREKLKELNYPVPQFVTVSEKDLDRIPELVEKIGFPLIVKNTDSSGSRGTKIFYENDPQGIADILKEAIRVSKSGLALIEECWEGPEQTVETIFDVSGKFHPCFITDRIFNRENGYAMEIGLRSPSNLPAAIQQEMFTVAENVARDLGIKVGAAKYDMILTPKGPRIIEMTVRLSGGFDCQYLTPAATGKNVMKAAILTALGENFSSALLENTKNKVGLSERIWPEPGKIVEIGGLEEAKNIPGVENIFFRYQLGDIIQPYIDCTKRVCFIIVTGKDEAEARLIMDEAKNTITIKTEPA